MPKSFRSLAEANRVRKVPSLPPAAAVRPRGPHHRRQLSFGLLGLPPRGQHPERICRSSPGPAHPGRADPGDVAPLPVAPKYQPIPLKLDITPDEQAFIAAHRDELPELETLDEQRRLYPNGGFVAHVSGTSARSRAELDNIEVCVLLARRCRRQSGVEETYDESSAGEMESRYDRQLARQGSRQAGPGTRHSRQGSRLTIDLDIQKAAENALEGKTGAIVAMDPHTGEILAWSPAPPSTLISSPFASPRYWQSILTNPDHPLINKTIQAQLAPG